MNVYILGVGLDVTNFYDNILLYAKHREWKTICTEDRIRQCEQMIIINNGIKANLVVFLKGDLSSHEVSLFEKKVSKLGYKFKDNFYVHRSDLNSKIIKKILYTSYKIPKNQSLDFYKKLEKTDNNIRYIDDMIELFDGFNDYFNPFEVGNIKEKSIADFDSQIMPITPMQSSMDSNKSSVNLEIESSDSDVSSEDINSLSSFGVHSTVSSLGILSYLSSSYYVGKNKNKNIINKDKNKNKNIINKDKDKDKDKNKNKDKNKDINKGKNNYSGYGCVCQ